jgi:hypothetical protein
MRGMSKTYILFVYGGWSLFFASIPARAQTLTGVGGSAPSCAAVLANDSTAGTHLGPTNSPRRPSDTSSRSRTDSASFGVGGARNGAADVILLVGIHADEVRFASQPHLRVRLCWGGDTVRVVQRDNLPSPVVPGTTYRNVYIAVELLGRVNAECLADKIGVGNNAPTSASGCAYLGGTAATGAAKASPPPP